MTVVKTYPETTHVVKNDPPPVCHTAVGASIITTHSHFLMTAIDDTQNFFFISIIADDWRCDQYRWVSVGVHRLPKTNPLVKKMYFQVDTPAGLSKLFQRHAYQLLCNTQYTLVHYLGDSSVHESVPHRNCTTQEGAAGHQRTLLSYLDTLKQQAVGPKQPAVIYKAEVAGADIDTSYLAINTPRNMKQVRTNTFTACYFVYFTTTAHYIP